MLKIYIFTKYLKNTHTNGDLGEKGSENGTQSTSFNTDYFKTASKASVVAA